MNIRRLLIPAAAVGTLALALGGCGVSGNSNGSSSSDGEQSSSENGAALDEAIMAVTDEELQGATVTLARFFGDCNETTNGVTDMELATTECEAIQILTNKFEAENPWGIKIERMGGAAWHSYYDSLNTSLASSDRPDLAVMHGSYIPEYAERGLLVEVPSGLGIDTNDLTAAAKTAVDYKGTQYAVPFDSHAIIFHLNLDILSEAGLVEDGVYTPPTSPEELYEHAQAVKDKTGKTYLDIALTNDPMGSRLFQSLIWQQDSNMLNPETGEVTFNTDAAKNALEVINTLVEEGYSDPTHDYDGSTQAFLRGESAIMYNGSWIVNQFAAETPFEYGVSNAAMLYDVPATLADSHLWVVPTQVNPDPVKYRAAFELAKYYYENTDLWAIKTGQMPASQTALDSAEYLAAPLREDYLETAREWGTLPPRSIHWPAIDAAMKESIEATWLNGAPIDSTLEALQTRVEGIVNK